MPAMPHTGLAHNVLLQNQGNWPGGACLPGDTYFPPAFIQAGLLYIAKGTAALPGGGRRRELSMKTMPFTRKL